MKLTTQELFDEYFKDNPESQSKRSNIDKPVLYEYEKEIGKTLLDMDRGEMLELIYRYAKGIAKCHPYIVTATVDSVSSRIRLILDWYSRSYDKSYQNVLKKSSNKQSESILWAVIHKAGRITHKDFQNIVRQLHNDCLLNDSISNQDYTRADYLELLMMLFYSGFYEAKEIVKVTEIDIENKTCKLPDRIITLTNRTFELLTAFHNQEVLTIPNGNSVIQHPLCSWHGSYLKFFVQSSKTEQFNNRSESTVSRSINYNISYWAGNQSSTWVCSKALYWLGVYNRLVSVFGEEELSKMILSSDTKYDQLLHKAWKQEITYRTGFNEFKRCLWQFIDTQMA